MRRVELFIKYLRNNRYVEYRSILQEALRSEFKICSVIDSLGYLETNSKILVLRHDVDQHSPGTKQLFDIERDLGVTASYYFRKSTLDPDFIAELESKGFEGSFHFETIADFAKERRIESKSELERYDYRAICLERLQKDIEWFRTRTGARCQTVAAHGDPLNRTLKISNNILTDDPKVYPRLGIRLEAYQSEYLTNFTSYISDAALRLNDGYMYGQSPVQAVQSGSGRILFLSHPHLWKLTPQQWTLGAARALLSGGVRSRISFRRLYDVNED